MILREYEKDMLVFAGMVYHSTTCELKIGMPYSVSGGCNSGSIQEHLEAHVFVCVPLVGLRYTSVYGTQSQLYISCYVAFWKLVG